MTSDKLTPLVSIIFAAYNESGYAEKLLKTIRSQTYKNIQSIIVVDNKTTDNTFEIGKQLADIAVIGSSERSENRNIGVNKSTGQYLLILDADMMLSPEVVQECVDVINIDPEIKTITIPEKSIGDSYWAKCKAFERSFYFLDKDNNIEAARFFEKKAFDEVGGYDPKITGPEDWDLPQSINKKYPKKFKIKSFIIHNEGTLSLKKLIKKKYYYGKKASVYMEKHEVSAVSASTIYFLRPIFYKHWKLWFKNPGISIGTIIMLLCEQLAGAVGFLQGKMNKE